MKQILTNLLCLFIYSSSILLGAQYKVVGEVFTQSW
ncbi:uncharacterized protein METZ01_LOCUS74251 [marine metagenome]|uniref:Uncharacterized protein n=1 Tax=marine metagenome TaxID=408172 RepID=A0A381U290_9ZZZZ